MKEELNIALVQANLVWEYPEANRAHLKELLEQSALADVYVLPEMFTTGFTMNASAFSETMDGTTVAWMRSLAKEKGAAIAGSMICEEQGKFYNRFVFVTETGEVNFYNKRHTFTLVGEERVYNRGEEKVIVDYKGWRLCLQVCYDLRFPVWARNVEVYDVLLYTANWPVKRIDAWDALLKARAIENMSYVVGVNRVGKDGNEILYNGHSAAFGVLGAPLVFSEDKEEVLVATLNYGVLTELRDRFKFLDDQDRFDIHV
ncbi:carbon-nitrogen hydrolase [Neptunitalea chrysea]|uniref:Omega-amidase YafV n=1 Tax=Neptunitalea chrysea TaxID=1647581 RepID=A0A9W6B9B4_9FLAO|nr:amidohydrolase [Neptunitalea chrysea]GLB54074.1 carbon-nitrogen hydrolase [Neptunitalea chrysea]